MFLKTREMLSKIVSVLLAIFIIWGGLFAEIASSQQPNYRLSNLEADINRVESRLNNVEAQLNQIRPSSSRTQSIPPQPLPSRRNLAQKEQNQMFDRMATLIVELKQQINKLEARVSKLES
jgi:peptidoglycan hydrolase CwlO-like protein